MTDTHLFPFKLHKASPGLLPCRCGKAADLMWFDRTIRSGVVTLFRVMCSGMSCPRSSRTWPKQEEAEREWNQLNAVKATGK